jgi:hypothetical protein
MDELAGAEAEPLAELLASRVDQVTDAALCDTAPYVISAGYAAGLTLQTAGTDYS